MWDLIQKSGVFGYLIIICSVFAVAIIIERYIAFRKIKLKDPDFLIKIVDALNSGTIEKILPEIEASASPVAKLVYEIVKRHVRDGNGKESKEAIERTVRFIAEREVREMERFLPSLASIAQVSPLLGLLGTVVGMIKAFMVIQQYGGRVNAQVLAGGIWEAMLTTAMGLIVAIPAMLAYNYFNSRIDRIVGMMDEIGNELLHALEKANYLEKG